MKISKKVLPFFALFSLVLALPAFAQSRRLYDQRCIDGICLEAYHLDQRLIFDDSHTGNQLFAVSVELLYAEEEPELTTKWVNCSLSNPFMVDAIRQADSLVFLHYLSPASPWENLRFRYSGYNLYWATCHNRFQMDDDSLRSLAIELGYELNAPIQTIALPIALFESMFEAISGQTQNNLN